MRTDIRSLNTCSHGHCARKVCCTSVYAPVRVMIRTCVVQRYMKRTLQPNPHRRWKKLIKVSAVLLTALALFRSAPDPRRSVGT